MHDFAFDADYDHGPRKVGALVCDLRLDIMLRVRVAAPMYCSYSPCVVCKKKIIYRWGDSRDLQGSLRFSRATRNPCIIDLNLSYLFRVIPIYHTVTAHD